MGIQVVLDAYPCLFCLQAPRRVDTVALVATEPSSVIQVNIVRTVNINIIKVHSLLKGCERFVFKIGPSPNKCVCGSISMVITMALSL